MTTLYRGMSIDATDSDIPDELFDAITDFVDGYRRPRFGAELLDFIQNHGSPNPLLGLGRHWTRSIEVARTASTWGAGSTLRVIITAEWDGTGEDEAGTNRYFDIPEEEEVTLLPGAKVEVTGLHVSPVDEERWTEVLIPSMLMHASESTPLYRGMVVSMPRNLDLSDPRAILAHLESTGEKYGIGLGIHWSLYRPTAESFANWEGEPEDPEDALCVFMEAEWLGEGSDVDATDRNRQDFGFEFEETLKPGTRLVIRRLEVWRPDPEDPYEGRIDVRLFEPNEIHTAALAKSKKCKFCEEPATHRTIWAEGMASVSTCDEHVQKAEDTVGADEVVRVEKVADLDWSLTRPDDAPAAVAGQGLTVTATIPLPPEDNVAADGYREWCEQRGKNPADLDNAAEYCSGWGEASDAKGIYEWIKPHRTAGWEDDPLARMLDDDYEAIVDLLGGPMTTYEPYTPPERPKFDPIPGVEPGWEEYALDLLDQEDRTHTADLWLPTDVAWYYREYDRSGNTGQSSAVEYALRQNGLRVPVLISTDGHDALLIEGNHRVMLARKLGITSIPVRIQWDPSGVRANEGTPVPLEPMLAGFLETNRDELIRRRTASIPQTLYRGLSVDLPYDDMDADFILDYLEGHHPDGLGLGRHWSTDQQVAFRSVASYGTGIVIGVRWDGRGADPDRTNTRGDWPDEQEVTLLPGTPVQVVSLLVRDDSGRWEERLEVPEERQAHKVGMSLVDVYLTYPHQPMDEQGRVLLWRGVTEGFQKFHHDDTRSPSMWWQDPTSADEALANIAENWGGYGAWWATEQIAKDYAGRAPQSSLVIGAWFDPDDITRPGVGYEGVLAADGAKGEVESIQLWTGSYWKNLGGKGKSVTAVTDTEFLRGDPDLKDVAPGTVLYRGVRLPLDDPAMADVRAVLEEGGWRDPRLGVMLLDHMEGAGSGGYRLGRHWSLDKSIAKMFSGGSEQSSSPLTEGTLAVVLTARYGGTGGTFVGRDSYHYRESEVVLEPDSPVEITDVEVFAWGTPSSVLTSPQLRVAGMTTAGQLELELGHLPPHTTVYRGIHMNRGPNYETIRRLLEEQRFHEAGRFFVEDFIADWAGEHWSTDHVVAQSFAGPYWASRENKPYVGAVMIARTTGEGIDEEYTKDTNENFPEEKELWFENGAQLELIGLEAQIDGGPFMALPVPRSMITADYALKELIPADTEWDPIENPTNYRSDDVRLTEPSGTWYHVTSWDRFQPGDIVLPAKDSPYGAYNQHYYDQLGEDKRAGYVWVAQNLGAAFAWASSLYASNIWEVHPLSTPQPWNIDGGNGWVCDGARLVRKVSESGGRDYFGWDYDSFHDYVTASDMGPGLAPDDGSDSLAGDSEIGSDGTLSAPSGGMTANRSDVVLGELGEGMIGTDEVSPGLAHVSQIVGLRPDPEVIGMDAWRIVAGMTDDFAVGNGSVEDRVGHNVCAKNLSGEVDPSVPIIVSQAGPLPAADGGRLAGHLPAEGFLGGHPVGSLPENGDVGLNTAGLPEALVVGGAPAADSGHTVASGNGAGRLGHADTSSVGHAPGGRQSSREHSADQRTAASPQTLYRGLCLNIQNYSFPKELAERITALFSGEGVGDFGDLILDYLARGNWQSDSGVGLGRHWSVNQQVARDMADQRTGHISVVLEADWDGIGEDPNKTNQWGDFPEEEEITLLPGTPVNIRSITVRAHETWDITDDHSTWHEVLTGSQMRTAEQLDFGYDLTPLPSAQPEILYRGVRIPGDKVGVGEIWAVLQNDPSSPRLGEMILDWLENEPRRDGWLGTHWSRSKSVSERFAMQISPGSNVLAVVLTARWYGDGADPRQVEFAEQYYPGENEVPLRPGTPLEVIDVEVNRRYVQPHDQMIWPPGHDVNPAAGPVFWRDEYEDKWYSALGGPSLRTAEQLVLDDMPTRYEMPVSELYRGLVIYADQWGTDEIMAVAEATPDSPRLGPMILDWLEGAPEISGRWLGKHWSLDRGVANSFAFNGSALKHISVILTAHWNGNRLDREFTDRANEEYRWEDEIALQPGAQLEIVNVEVCRRNLLDDEYSTKYYSVLPTPQQRTAEQLQLDMVVVDELFRPVPETLYRGMALDPTEDDYIMQLVQAGSLTSPNLGNAILDYLDRQGASYWGWMGRHWSRNRAISRDFATPSTNKPLGVVITAQWNGLGRDKDSTGTDGYHPDEEEVTLLPGTPVTVTKVEVMVQPPVGYMRPSDPASWNTCFEGAQQRTAEQLVLDDMPSTPRTPYSYEGGPKKVYRGLTIPYGPGADELWAAVLDDPTSTRIGPMVLDWLDRNGSSGLGSHWAGFSDVAYRFAAGAGENELMVVLTGIWDQRTGEDMSPEAVDNRTFWNDIEFESTLLPGTPVEVTEVHINRKQIKAPMMSLYAPGSRNNPGPVEGDLGEYLENEWYQVLGSPSTRLAGAQLMLDIPVGPVQYPTVIYRGYNLSPSDVSHYFNQLMAAESYDSPHLGQEVLDFLEASNPAYGWLGTHWSSSKSVSVNFAKSTGEGWGGYPVVITATWNNLDRDWNIDTDGEWPEEKEVGLFPGTPVTITAVEVMDRDGNWHNCLAGPQTRTASTPGTLYRGLRVDLPSHLLEKLTGDTLETIGREIEVGPELLDMITATGGLGTHWSTRPEIAERFALNSSAGSSWGVGVLLTAQWDGSGEDPDRTGVGGFGPNAWADEAEVTLLPGTPLTITSVVVGSSFRDGVEVLHTDKYLGHDQAFAEVGRSTPVGGPQTRVAFGTSDWEVPLKSLLPSDPYFLEPQPVENMWGETVEYEPVEYRAPRDDDIRATPPSGRWYHVSPQPLSVGDRVRPSGAEPSDPAYYEEIEETYGRSNRRDYVWLAQNLGAACFWSWALHAPYIYRVHPTSTPQAWNFDGTNGWVADGARVEEVVSTGGPQGMGIAYTDYDNYVTALRHVRDEEYWGLPEGTPIVPGQKPEPKENRAPVEDEVPADVEYEDAPKADKGPKLRVTPDMSEEEVDELVEEFKKLPGKMSDYIDYEVMEDSLVAKFNVATPEQKEWGEAWYATGQEYIENIAAKTGFSPHQVAAVVAAFSPRNPWDPNVSVATHFLMNWDPRDPDAAAEKLSPDDLPGLAENLARAKRVMQAEDDPDAVLDALGTHEGAPKIRNFYKNLMGDENSVTIDTWMAKAMVGEGLDVAPSGFAGKVLGWGYDGMADAVRNAADRLGVTPAALQAIVWTQVNNTADYAPWTPETYRKKKRQREKAWERRPFQKPIPDYERGPAWDSVHPETGEPFRPAPTYKDSPALHWREPQPSVLTDKAAALLLGDQRYVRDESYWGVPAGTPISPGMKPKPQEDRVSVEDEVPENVEYEEAPEPPLKDKVVEPSDDLMWEVDGTWMGAAFDTVKDGIRAGAMRAITEGYSGPPEGVTGWRLQKLLRDYRNPETMNIIGGELVARAVHSEPTTKPLYRGAAHEPEFVAELKEGGTISMPLSSFDLYFDKVGQYIDPEPDSAEWASATRPENGVPVLYTLEPGAHAAQLTLEHEPDSEHLTFGEFEIVQVKPGMRGVKRGATQVIIRQVSMTPKARELSSAQRYVRDSDYWGVPEGTPITPGMKPKPKSQKPTQLTLPLDVKRLPGPPRKLTEIEFQRYEPAEQHEAIIDDIVSEIAAGSYFAQADGYTKKMIKHQLSVAPYISVYEGEKDFDTLVDEIERRVYQEQKDRPIPAWPGPELDPPLQSQFEPVSYIWRIQKFYELIDDVRKHARDIQANGWKRPPIDGFNATDPQTIAGTVLGAIASHPPQRDPMFRGMKVSRDYADRFEVGARLSMGLSSFTDDSIEAEAFAEDPTLGGQNQTQVREDAEVPLVLEVMEGARGVPANPFGSFGNEIISCGQFEVTDVDYDGDTKYVTLKQTSPLEAR